MSTCFLVTGELLRFHIASCGNPVWLGWPARLPFGQYNRASPAADEHVKPILPTSLRQISSCTPVAKDAPAKALVWKQSRKPDWNGHKHYQAKTAAGCYSVAAEYQPGKGFIGYRVTQSVADKRRVIASSITVDEGKALAQRDYEQGDADDRTRQAPQPMTIRVPLG